MNVRLLIMKLQPAAGQKQLARTLQRAVGEDGLQCCSDESGELLDAQFAAILWVILAVSVVHSCFPLNQSFFPLSLLNFCSHRKAAGQIC